MATPEIQPDTYKSKNLTIGQILSRSLWCVIAVLVFCEAICVGMAIHARVGIRYKADKNIHDQYVHYYSLARDSASSSSPQKVRDVQEILDSYASSSERPSAVDSKINIVSSDSPPPLAPIQLNASYGDPEKLSTGDDLLDNLIKEARAAQIEGDMRKATLKLEEALSHHANHPAALYYLGITYEMVQNTSKAREYYLQVFQQRESAGPYYAEASKKLQMGFDLAEDMRGKISFGPIRVFKDPEYTQGESVLLTIPVRIAPGVSIQPKDLFIPIQFFDIINEREITSTRAITEVDSPRNKWLSDTHDWSEGERILEVRYKSTASPEEILALGDFRYYGFTAKLYYKGEPMDCKSTPNSLILVEYKKQQASDDFDDIILPPLETTPVSEGLLPYDSGAVDDFYIDDNSDLPPFPPPHEH